MQPCLGDLEPDERIFNGTSSFSYGIPTADAAAVSQLLNRFQYVSHAFSLRFLKAAASSIYVLRSSNGSYALELKP